MPIRVLEPEVAVKIAAGEVVERPASVVKELVENALDAGATAITVETRQGGRELIRVTDNGCGIPADEVELAFQRHATSKIQTAEELSAVGTLGFRGEALPSIAAVARVVMVTRSPETTAGVMVEAQGGRIVARRFQGAAPGTSVTVHELFRDVPARRKFLRSPGAETARIHILVAHFGLAHPQVRFTWLVDGRPSLVTSGEGSLQDAVAKVYGGEVAQQLLPVSVEEEESRYRVEGLMSPPSLTRPNRSAESFFINGRWIQSRLLGYAVEEAYRGFLMERRYPLVVMKLSVPLDEVDVNVHPAKNEVRFLKEREAFSAVQRAVRRGLVAASPVPEVRLPPAAVSRFNQRTWTNAFALIPPNERQAPPTEPTPQQVMLDQGVAMPLLRVLGQVANTYIIAEGPDGVYLIDQHAAHEQVLFERVLRQVRDGRPEVQGMLEPLVVELGSGQAEVVLEQRELLAAYGFHVEPFGESACLLRGVPAVSRDAQPAHLFVELAGLLAEERSSAQREHVLAASIACHSAVRAGMALEQSAMVALVRDLEAAENPRTCPHGRPTTIHLSASHLEREFGRR